MDKILELKVSHRELSLKCESFGRPSTVTLILHLGQEKPQDVGVKFNKP